MELNLFGTVNDSIVDGPGLRFSVFVQGCPHNCKGCHNPGSHAFEGGTRMTTDELFRRIQGNPLLDGVTFSGGEPFCQPLPLAELGRQVKTLGLNIVTFTGYTFEQLYAQMETNEGYAALLSVTDYLIDGPFVEELRSLELRFRGSSNQRCIDVQKSLAAGKAIEADI